MLLPYFREHFGRIKFSGPSTSSVGLNADNTNSIFNRVNELVTNSQSHSHFQDHIFNIPGNCTVQNINQYWYNICIMSRLLCELTQSLLFAIATLSDTGSHSRFDLIESFAPTHYVCNMYIYFIILL